MDGWMDGWMDSHGDRECIASLAVTCLPGAEVILKRGAARLPEHPACLEYCTSFLLVLSRPKVFVLSVKTESPLGQRLRLRLCVHRGQTLISFRGDIIQYREQSIPHCHQLNYMNLFSDIWIYYFFVIRKQVLLESSWDSLKFFLGTPIFCMGWNL